MPRATTERHPDQALFDELSFYTLAQPRSEFIHQLAIDTYTAQHATAATQAHGDYFAVLGLYLHAERGFTGLRYSGSICGSPRSGCHGRCFRCLGDMPI